MTDYNQTFIDYEAVPIEVLTFGGNADRNFVFVGGFADPVQNHADILHGISKKGYNVYAINMPGHGNSGTIPFVNWRVMVRILAASVDGFDLNDFSIGGFSMGGGVALKYASEFPDKISDIRLLSPLCYELPHLPTLIKQGLGFYHNLMNNALKNPTEKSLPFPIRPIYYAMSYGPILYPPWINVENLEGKRIHIMVGELDEIIDIERIRKQFGSIPGIIIESVPGFGHDIYYVKHQIIESVVDGITGMLK